MSKKDSGPIKLLQVVWSHANEGKDHSWTILNRALQSALSDAIRNGFKFELDDFAEIDKRFNGGYWLGNSIPPFLGERYYCIAATGAEYIGSSSDRYDVANRSACISFEKWVGRKPFILKGQRLAVWSKLQIDGKQYFVTSFAKDNLSIGVGGYHSEKNPYGHRDGSPTRRFKLTHADVKAIEKETFVLK